MGNLSESRRADQPPAPEKRSQYTIIATKKKPMHAIPKCTPRESFRTRGRGTTTCGWVGACFGLCLTASPKQVADQAIHRGSGSRRGTICPFRIVVRLDTSCSPGAGPRLSRERPSPVHGTLLAFTAVPHVQSRSRDHRPRPLVRLGRRYGDACWRQSHSRAARHRRRGRRVPTRDGPPRSLTEAVPRTRAKRTAFPRTMTSADAMTTRACVMCRAFHDRIRDPPSRGRAPPKGDFMGRM